jgi:hypothetical protein
MKLTAGKTELLEENLSQCHSATNPEWTDTSHSEYYGFSKQNSVSACSRTGIEGGHRRLGPSAFQIQKLRLLIYIYIYMGYFLEVKERV